ncbi:hypothetical protein, partial [Bacteroides fragilis]
RIPINGFTHKYTRLFLITDSVNHIIKCRYPFFQTDNGIYYFNRNDRLTVKVIPDLLLPRQ